MTSQRQSQLVIALASLSLISLEIVWTRVFSAEFFYTFAFLILSLAVLGLGLGGLALRLRPSLAQPRHLGTYLVLTALLALIGPPIVLRLGLEFTQLFAGWGMIGRLLLALGLLGSGFFTGGMALSLLFRTQHGNMPRLYMADLLGAAAGVLLAVLLMNTLGTPGTLILVGLPLLAGAFLCSPRSGKVASVLVAAVTLALLPFAGRLIAKPRQERLPVVHRHWDTMALVKILKGEGCFTLNIDNTANTSIWEFDGNWEELRRQPSSFMADPKPLMDRMDGGATFLSIGSGGGADATLALQNHAREVHAVEVNPYLNSLLLPGGKYHDFSGRLYSDPRVKVRSEDARSYVRRFDGHFDLIASFSSNTFAALASGAFALAENYIFTTEAFRDYYKALTPRGYLLMEHQYYMPRIVSEALDGLRSCGVTSPERHIAVFALPGARRHVILVGKAPLDRLAIEGGLLALHDNDFKRMHRVYPDPHPQADRTIERIVRDGWQTVARTVPTDISPATDNRPFIAQQGLMKNFTFRGLAKIQPWEDRGYPLAKLIIAAILLVLCLVILPLNLLPRLGKGPKLGARGWLYFFAIGMGFMIVEVVLIQRYTLFIGPSAYTVVAILFTLLVGSGLGSRFAPRFEGRLPFLAILGWLALEILLFSPLTRVLAVLPMMPRILCTIVFIAPLGFFMGMPFPRGTARVGELVDWGFAVNGAASVLGSASIMLVSFAWGFNAALLVGGASYLAAMLLMEGRQGWGDHPQAPTPA